MKWPHSLRLAWTTGLVVLFVFAQITPALAAVEKNEDKGSTGKPELNRGEQDGGAVVDKSDEQMTITLPGHGGKDTVLGPEADSSTALDVILDFSPDTTPQTGSTGSPALDLPGFDFSTDTTPQTGSPALDLSGLDFSDIPGLEAATSSTSGRPVATSTVAGSTAASVAGTHVPAFIADAVIGVPFLPGQTSFPGPGLAAATVQAAGQAAGHLVVPLALGTVAALLVALRPWAGGSLAVYGLLRRWRRGRR